MFYLSQEESQKTEDLAEMKKNKDCDDKITPEKM
jgi:hypothetical protein